MDGLVGLWQDKDKDLGGSKYEVTLDDYVDGRWPTCSVNILKAGGASKFLQGVIQMNRHGCISWNDSYYLNIAATDANSAQWTPVRGVRNFVWSRIIEPEAEHRDRVYGIEGSEPAWHRRWVPVDPSSVGEGEPLEVAKHMSQNAGFVEQGARLPMQKRWVPVDPSSVDNEEAPASERADAAQISSDAASRALVAAVVARAFSSIDSYITSSQIAPGSTDDVAGWDRTSSSARFNRSPGDEAAGLASDARGEAASDQPAAPAHPALLPEGGMLDMLDGLSGSWFDCDGFAHDVVPDERCISRLPSCTVSTRELEGHMPLNQSSILLHHDGTIVWASDYVLDCSSSAAGSSVRWFIGTSEFRWSRLDRPQNSYSVLEGSNAIPRQSDIHEEYVYPQEHHESQGDTHVAEGIHNYIAVEHASTNNVDEVNFGDSCRSLLRGGSSADATHAGISNGWESGAGSPLFSLIGLWSDQSGSTYDVKKDSMQRGCPTLSVKFKRPDGRVKVARQVVWLGRDGRIAWNDKYFVDCNALTLTHVRWKPARGIRDFVWTRPMPERRETAEAQHRDGRGAAYEPASSHFKENVVPHYVWKDTSIEAKVKPLRPRDHSRSRAEVVARPSGNEILGNLEELVGCWEEIISHSEQRSHTTTHEVTVDRNAGQPLLSLNVKSQKSRRGARPTDSTIEMLGSGLIVWNGGHSLDVSALARRHAQWNPLAGGRGLTWSRIEGVQPCPLDAIVGQWCDAGAMMYDVSREEEVGQAPRSCAVKFWKAGYKQTSPGLIWLTEDGHIAWGHTYILDASASSHGFGRWISSRGDSEFRWYRVESSVPHPDFSHTELWSPNDSASVESKTALRDFDLSPHFCIFEQDPRGICCWSRQRDAPNNWDEILLSLLSCVMMDGDWAGMIDASAYVGAEAVHVSGEVQQLLSQPDVVTPSLWEELMWKYYGQKAAGLSWELMGQDWHMASSEDTQLMRVEALLDAAPPNSVALVFDNGLADVTYQDLKLQGMYRAPNAQKVFFLMGAPNSFSGIVDRFKHRLGNDSVLRVSLGAQEGAHVGIPMAKVAVFLTAEFSRGTLAYAVAGLECRRDAEKSAYAVAGLECRHDAEKSECVLALQNRRGWFGVPAQQQQISVDSMSTALERQTSTDGVSIVADFEERFFFLSGAARNFQL